MNNSWVCCQLDMPEQFELCRIQQEKITFPDSKRVDYIYHVITYYDGKNLFTGSRKACQKWINDHYVSRRYLDCYGKED